LDELSNLIPPIQAPAPRKRIGYKPDRE